MKDFKTFLYTLLTAVILSTMGLIGANALDINTLKAEYNHIAKSLERVETKLGTLPAQEE